MGMKGLSLASLVELDMGMIDVAFKAELKRVIDDLADRPGDKTNRSVTLQIKLAPERNDAGVCTGANVEFMVNSSVPKKRTRQYSMRVHPRGELLFNPESTDDHRQHTLDEVDRTKPHA